MQMGNSLGRIELCSPNIIALASITFPVFLADSTILTMIIHSLSSGGLCSLKTSIFIEGSDVDFVLGNLPVSCITSLKYWHDLLVNKVRAYHASHHQDHLLALLKTSMCHAFLCITIALMTHCQMVQNVPEFQQFCLNVRVYLDYVTIYQPCLTAPDEETNKIPVANHLMAAFTEDDMVLMQLVKMRIPVLHVQPSFKLLPNMNI